MKTLKEIRQKRSTKAKKLRAYFDKFAAKGEATDIEKLTVEALIDTVELIDILIKKRVKRMQQRAIIGTY